MAAKKLFLIIDTETTINDHVADFGAILCDKNGNIVKECGVMIADFRNEELFYDKSAANIWGKSGLIKRTANYNKMLDSGQRMLASVNAVNRWLDRVNSEFKNVTFTAYNLAFDLDKMQNSGIDTSMFSDRFCLWQAATGIHASSKKYREFILENHYFNNRTKFGNMTYKTDAETMAHFVTGEYSEEPHTALEDAKFYELPILVDLVKRRNFREKVKPYSWRDYQMKNNFKA